MLYIIILLLLFVLELVYFRIADQFNIIDKPNQRSSHVALTLRGGGIIFYFAVSLYFFISGYEYPWFFIGLTLMTIVSFLDDILTLSNKIRLAIHFISVLLMAYELNIFNMPWYYLLATFIITVGVINAYNFMDGINGITACYSLSIGGLLMVVNRNEHFISQDFLIYTMLGLAVFTFFNFRTNAKCFAGDVGSVSIAFILLFALGALIITSGKLVYVLFLAVYGIDAVWTIIRRIYLKEDIFSAHRSHLYQYLGNEVGINKLLISFFYGFIQLLIGWLVIETANKPAIDQLWISIILLVCMSILYLFVKAYVVRKFVRNDL
ncbi:glycosyltransferase family 4 protein [Sphingobacterium sp. DR205]|uniref:MraY family glycosyltransferase n=1 Tax=Sphingobacterium sp. DR205 TaxID=2713573 RepID=UPI0013E4ACBE|nr:glycosyltransferase family 4 protein [Sphingobacterium sp. DR205]QIH31576.1 glycosyltransferase family 4 protein [Sphingobacterium sp. DR205]